MYCSKIKNNRYCKNHIHRNGLCYIHCPSKSRTKVKFNEKLNTILIVERYIHTLEKLKNGDWKYN